MAVSGAVRRSLGPGPSGERVAQVAFGDGHQVEEVYRIGMGAALVGCAPGSNGARGRAGARLDRPGIVLARTAELASRRGHGATGGLGMDQFRLHLPRSRAAVTVAEGRVVHSLVGALCVHLPGE